MSTQTILGIIRENTAGMSGIDYHTRRETLLERALSECMFSLGDGEREMIANEVRELAERLRKGDAA